ncbi:hypothetical protein [Nitrospira sp. Nam74]
MQLELTTDQARVLTVLTEYTVKHPDILKAVYAGYENDMKTFQGIAGQLRAKYQMEK